MGQRGTTAKATAGANTATTTRARRGCGFFKQETESG